MSETPWKYIPKALQFLQKHKPRECDDTPHSARQSPGRLNLRRPKGHPTALLPSAQRGHL